MAKIDPTTEAPQVHKKGLEEWLAKLVNLVRDDDRSRWSWLRRQKHFLRRRYAKEFRETNWPWPDAADIVMPILDMAVDRLKPVFIQSTIGTRPVVTLIARNLRSQQKVATSEMFMDWLMESRIPDFSEQVAYGADYFLQYGQCIFKVYYDYRTRRVLDTITRDRLPEEIRKLIAEGDESTLNAAFMLTGIPAVSKKELKGRKEELRPLLRRHFGLDEDDPDDKKAETAILSWLFTDDDSVTVTMRDVVADSPRVASILPENIIVADYVTDIQMARRVTHRLFMTEEEIRERARDAGWIKESVDRMLSKDPSQVPGSGNFGQGYLEGAREEIFSATPRVVDGTFSLHDDLYEVWEVYTHFDLDNDGFAEKVVVTLDPKSLSILRMIALPFKHGKWPFIQVKFEYNEPQFYHTRGIAEKLDDLDVEITAQHRAKLNRMTIANAPVLLYRLGSKQNPNNLRFIPGQMYPVTDVQRDLAPLVFPNLDVSFEREEQILGSYVERYLGTLDTSLSEQDRLTRPRSATEIRAVGQIQAQTLGTRILMWQKGMAKVYNMVWDLYQQYGPQEAFVRVTGATDDEIVRLTRADIQGDYDFVPTPSALGDPGSRAQDAFTQLQLLLQIPQGSLGIQYEFNLAEAVLSYLEKVDVRNARRIVRKRNREEVEQVGSKMQELLGAGSQGSGVKTTGGRAASPLSF